MILALAILGLVAGYLALRYLLGVVISAPFDAAARARSRRADVRSRARAVIVTRLASHEGLDLLARELTARHGLAVTSGLGRLSVKGSRGQGEISTRDGGVIVQMADGSESRRVAGLVLSILRETDPQARVTG